MFSVTLCQLPQQLCDLFKANDTTHPYNTRHNPQLRLPLYKKTICHKSFLYQGPKLWFNLPAPLWQITSVKNFSYKLKSKFISMY